MVPPITPTEPMCRTSAMDNAIFTAAAKIDRNACSRVRVSAASKQDSTLMNPLISAHTPIASNRENVGTAAGPAHARIKVRPKTTNAATQHRLSTTVPFMVREKVRRIQP